MTKEKLLIGVGSPIVDLLAKVDENFLRQEVAGDKGGMVLVDAATLNALADKIPGEKTRAAGGSAGNTIFAAARLGARTAFVGKLAADAPGRFYQAELQKIGGATDRFKVCQAPPTGQCLSLITPDSERTMRTDLGAAATLGPAEITPADFQGGDLVHLEGYLLFNPELARAVLTSAQAAGCRVSLDLGSFEVVAAARNILPDLLREYVDFVFANEEEAAAFCGKDEPSAGLQALGALCQIAAVKLGAAGALIAAHGQPAGRVRAVAAKQVVDTTGAGDYWAAGFLYGLERHWSLEACGELGATLGAAVVATVGAELPENIWQEMRQARDKIAAKEAGK